MKNEAFSIPEDEVLPLDDVAKKTSSRKTVTALTEKNCDPVKSQKYIDPLRSKAQNKTHTGHTKKHAENQTYREPARQRQNRKTTERTEGERTEKKKKTTQRIQAHEQIWTE